MKVETTYEIVKFIPESHEDYKILKKMENWDVIKKYEEGSFELQEDHSLILTR